MEGGEQSEIHWIASSKGHQKRHDVMMVEKTVTDNPVTPYRRKNEMRTDFQPDFHEGEILFFVQFRIPRWFGSDLSGFFTR
jgi:hypothetical protein